MSGLDIRLRRLFERGNAFVVALDHGLVMGPLRGIEKPMEIVRKLSNIPDALQMTPAMLRVVEENFYSRSSPMLIARLDTANVWRKEKKYDTGYYSAVYSVRDAIEAGADAVVTYLVVGYGTDQVEGYNVEQLSLMRREANDYGVPFIIEPLFVSPENPDSIKDTNLVKYVTRLASEIGADILKVDYTGKDFKEVVDVAFAPILIRGGPKTNSNGEFLAMLNEAIASGAKGVTVGRNLWQSQDPAKIARAISMIVHERKSVEEALKVMG
ncbi:MAG: Fructose-bisphosphate aldolase [Candidatus Aramenus sulfurataquae]|jgi:class I fructose-bisphosphate aldolase|uniref:Aldolase n=2 Tax=Candidatus Aramenus sulfurataquae TaxID=1326980 RepID=W7L6Y7_9CREN|nr:MAG: Fructose-bisphosphate aldolase [Candidatus Aramenus sulfurataquae]MCL7343206.1 aldolase [Candidatus Aramenus sulfurataquae]